ncbi:MAG: thioredoxin [Candidatus Omnitrophica bacterium]|nr:thioredoxin [Candidatus Omnitrophota bacterium]MCM8792935.1 thioredoxin [Candidatus Omnitrophota bacterium]
MVKEITAKNFEDEVLNADLPVFIDFWAEWCGPCRAVSPVIEALSEEYKDKIKFTKINVDKFPEIAGKYGIMSIPTMLVFYQKKIIAQTSGNQSKAQLNNFLEEALKKK